MVNNVIIHRTTSVVRHILQVPPLANVPLHHGGGHATATMDVVVVELAAVGPMVASGGRRRRFEGGSRTVDYALAADHLLLVEIGRETVGRLHAKGAEIVLIVF